MNDEHPIQHSPLSRVVVEQGHTLEIRIYRGKNDAGWLLEVIDAEGTSTVWEDLFASDQAALDEVYQTIKDEGIEALVGLPPSPKTLH